MNKRRLIPLALDIGGRAFSSVLLCLAMTSMKTVFCVICLVKLI
jgi:hypothetical protein